MLKLAALAAVLSALVSLGASGRNQQAPPSTGRAARTTVNEAIAWSRVTAEKVNVGLTAREHTIVNVAMFEAANAVTKRYQPYALDLAAPPGTSIDAAVAAAAHDALAVVWPREKALWDQLYSDFLAGLDDGPARTQGIELGKAAAQGILGLRARDTPFPGPAFAPPPAMGIWRPNPPELTPIQAGVFSPVLGIPPLTAYAHWQPWTLADRRQFRPGPPPAVTSPQYARDLNEVKTVGAFESPGRTPDQTAEALFYMTPAPRIFAPFAHDVAIREALDLTDSARLFALLSLALLDSQIACWDAKLAYAQWRPLTAIREAERDGNPATAGDPNWIPRVPTPPFPDYPAAHSCSAGAAAAVLGRHVRRGESIPLRSPGTGIPPGSGASRQYADFAAVVRGVGNARVWAGVHFRSSTIAGADIGSKVGQWVMERTLTPVSARKGTTR
jgi:hypothetical protein